MARNTDIRNTDNIIDSGDVIARIEELQSYRESLSTDYDDAFGVYTENGTAENEITMLDARKALEVWDGGDGATELKALEVLQSEAEGCEDWLHGAPLIRDSYFTEYARDLCDDIDSGALKELPDYLKNNIDWDGVATDLQVDYTSVEFDGVTYWVR